MTGEELRAARGILGEMWGLSGPVPMAALGRVLGLKGRDPGEAIRDWERRAGPTGPAALAVTLMLGGAVPPDLEQLLAGPRASG